LLQDLPIEFWDVEVLKGIGDAMGNFVYFEEKYLHWDNKRMA